MDGWKTRKDIVLTEISIQFLFGISCEDHCVGVAALCVQLSGEIPLLLVSVQRVVAFAGRVGWYCGAGSMIFALLMVDAIFVY